MPKKTTRNAFYFFMLEFKEQQGKKGIRYENMAHIAEAAGPLWKEAPPLTRSKFEEMAKRAKQKYNCPTMKYTSTGVSYAEIERQEQELQEAKQAEMEEIKNIVTINNINGTIYTEDFYVMDVNAYCKTNTHYVIGECTVLRFNLKDGIKDNYHEVINIGSIPVGYAHDVKQGSKTLGLDMPDDSIPRSNYMQILANIIDYLNQKNSASNVLPPIFTLPDHVLPVQDFILQLCNKAAEDETLFRIYKLDTLFYNVINSIKSRGDEGFPKESLALSQLKIDRFRYTRALGCEHHEEVDKSTECTLSKVKCWVFTILDSCCAVAGIELVPGQHVPFDYDMDGILSIKEQRKGRMAASIAGFTDSSSCNTSIVSDSTLNSAATFGGVKKEKRVHEPLRMPKTDYSQMIRPAPQLTESDFPALTALHGCGRGSITSSLNKLKIEK